MKKEKSLAIIYNCIRKLGVQFNNLGKKATKILFACLVMLQSFIGYLPMTFEKVEAEEVTTINAFSDLKDKLGSTKDSYNAILGQDIYIDPTDVNIGTIKIQSGKTQTLDFNGHSIICVDKEGPLSANLKNGIFYLSGNLILKDSSKNTNNGFICNGNYSGFRAIEIDTSGRGQLTTTLSIDNLKFQGFTKSAVAFKSNDNAKSSPTLTITNSTFVDNSSTSSGGGALFISSLPENASAIIKNNLFESNKYIFDTSTTSPGGGAINISNSKGVTLEENTIQNNTVENKSGSILSTGRLLGGGISIINGQVELKNNKIKKNSTADNGSGGGISIRKEPNGGGITTISGDFIDGNAATRGGGIFIDNATQSPDPFVEIKSATISHNTAEDGGGIAFTENYSVALNLNNVEITRNKATVGGGIWLCPTAEGEFNSTLGGAIYGNTAEGSWLKNDSIHVYARGNEIRYSTKDEDDALFSRFSSSSKQMVTVSSRNHNGKTINWYADEVDHRFTRGDNPVNIDAYDGRKTAFSLARDDNDEYDDAAIKIVDNVATKRGGGIATNHILRVGEPIDIDLTVKKEFQYLGESYEDKELLPDAVYVNLIQIDTRTNTRKVIETVELNEKNNWEHTFKDLPAKYDFDGEYIYEYTVAESNETLLESKEADNGENGICDSEQRTCTITLTNRVVTPTDYKLNVEKQISGDIVKEDSEFIFELFADDQNGMTLPNDKQITIVGENNNSFDNIHFTKPGTYKVNVKEIKGTDSYTYDENVYTVTITVTEDENEGKLSVDDVKITKNNLEEDKVVFKNIYHAPRIPTYYNLEVEKIISGDTPKDNSEFTFELTAQETDGVELPKNLKTKVKGEGKTLFDKIKFTKEGTYTFNVKEVKGSDFRYNYDDSIWTVTIEVVADREGNLSVDSLSFEKNDKYYKKLFFENTYTDFVNPKTGDNISLSMIFLVISSILMTALILNFRKKIMVEEVNNN